MTFLKRNKIELSQNTIMYESSGYAIPKPASWSDGAKNHARRIAYSFLSSELLPAFARIRVMRRLGFDIDRSACIWAKCEFRSNKVSIGPAVFINIGFFHDGSAQLSVGRNVRMGQFVRVLTGTHEIGPSTQRCLMKPVDAPVSIGSGCWIGAGVTILPGVSIAEGCVIGAASMVAQSTEPNGVYVGNPARRIRSLPT